MAKTTVPLPEIVRWAPHPHTGKWRVHVWTLTPQKGAKERYVSHCFMRVKTTPTPLDLTMGYNKKKAVFCEMCKEKDDAQILAAELAALTAAPTVAPGPMQLTFAMSFEETR